MIRPLEAARARGCSTALATRSGCKQAQQVLEALDLAHGFDFVGGTDDVARGKHDPEITCIVCEELGAGAEQSLALEDSPLEIRAVHTAGLQSSASAVPFARERTSTRAFWRSDGLVTVRRDCPSWHGS